VARAGAEGRIWTQGPSTRTRTAGSVAVAGLTSQGGGTAADGSSGVRPFGQPSRTSSPWTVMVSSSRGAAAGPLTTEPSSAENTLP
jgi:hypothetical protein